MTQDPGNSRYGTVWSREESVLAFELYCRIPFQRTKANNPAVQELAHLLGRTPAAVARKLGNYGAFDPELQRNEISGLSHTSKLDRQVWDEFHQDWSGLVWEANRIRQDVQSRTESRRQRPPPSGASETVRMTKQRLHQAFFRETVLSSYASTCCVTGISVPQCLIASHIIPWSVEEKLRANPTNGLCLSATFDRLYDVGLMTVTPDFFVRFSHRIAEYGNEFDRELICSYQGRLIKKPHRFSPNAEFLEWHLKNRFESRIGERANGQ